MRPQSIVVLAACVVIAIAAFVVGVLLDCHVLDEHLWLFCIKDGGPLAALAFAFVHFLRSRPSIFDFKTEDWKMTGETWKDVWICISASTHQKGKTPTVSFLAYNDFVRDFGLTYKIEPNGDVLICHLHNQFVQPWASFRVKITM